METELKKGALALKIASTLKLTKKEALYVEALKEFYNNWETTDHYTRCLKFEKAMESIYQLYPNDAEAAAFYALSLNAAVKPEDKSFVKQKKAAMILKSFYTNLPDHPGLAHYLIHTYDYPELSMEGLQVARRYASIAPSSAHALHMPSHIFTRLGLWGECIQSNQQSVNAAQCYAKEAGLDGHWDEELHGLDYLTYGYLQQGDNDSAKVQWNYLKTVNKVSPVNFKVAYAFAAIPSRYLLENRMWKEASELSVTPSFITWKNYPWQEAIIHFARCMGASRSGNISLAHQELAILKKLHSVLVEQKDEYKATQVSIQLHTAEAWLLYAEGKTDKAITLMEKTATMEDFTEKHPVTPGEVLPAKELLGDMLLQFNQPEKALIAYEQNLKRHPNRFNALFGAASAADRCGEIEKAKQYFGKLLSVAKVSSKRVELQSSRMYLRSHP